jgi:hypothetical protein
MSRALYPIAPAAAVASIGHEHRSQDQYEEDCLHGRRFPRPGDTAMWERCRQSYRIREWVKLFIRFHVSRCIDRANPKTRFGRYFAPILPLKPADLSRPLIQQWFRAIGDHSPMQANAALSMLRTMYRVMETWDLWYGPNPCRDFRWYPRQ